MAAGCAPVNASRDMEQPQHALSLPLSDDALLDHLQRAAFGYFLRVFDPGNGLLADTTREGSPCSIAVVGFALSVYPIAVERGWMTRADAVAHSLAALRFFRDSDQSGTAQATGYKGFYYHFLDMHTGARVWQSELSMIDTALLLAGTLTAASYFNADSAGERELRDVADVLYRRADWCWAQGDQPTLRQGWKPECGFLNYGWDGYNEGLVLYVLALGSPTHPIQLRHYAAWTATYQWENLYDIDFLYAGPLFIHQFSHAWIDFRGIRDDFMREKHCDYFENSRRATEVQREYARRNPHGFSGYDEDCWGLTACDGPSQAPPALADQIVVGGGTTGLVAAQAAAALGKKVALVERRLLGGNCLHIGCVPSKALIRTSRLYAEMRDAERYGAQVRQTTIVQHWPLFLPREERDAAQILSDAFARDGIAVRLNTQVVGVRVESGQKLVDLVSDDHHSTIEVDAILTGTGRVPSIEGLGLDAAGVEHHHTRGVQVDDFLCSSNDHIYAAGDVCLDEKFNDTADASARIAVRNALCRGRERFSALTIPWCTYTDPEIAHVGLYVRQARERNIPVKTFTVLMHDVDRAVTDSEEAGFVKIHVREGTDRILGATIVARHAGEMISEITLAMVAGAGLRTLSRVMHPYPTQGEAITQAAAAYLRTLPSRVACAGRRWRLGRGPT